MVPFRIRHADKVAGAFIASAAVIVLVVLLLIIKGQQLFLGRVPFHTVFDEGGGVAPETPVKISGIEVGKVRKVSLTDDNRVRVDFDVLETFADRVRGDPPGGRCERALHELVERCGFTAFGPEVPPEPGTQQRSCAELEEDKKLCGSRVKASLPAGLGAFLPGGGGLVITVGNINNEPLERGGLVPSEVAKGLNDMLQELAQQGVVQNAQDIVEQIAILLKRINDVKGPIWESIENVRAVTVRVRDGQGPVGQAFTPGSPLEKRIDAALEKLDSAMVFVQSAAENLDQITTDADQRLVALYDAIDNLQKFSETAKVAIEDLRVFAEGSKEVPPAMTRAIENIDRRVDDLGDIIRGLKQSFPLNLVVDEKGRPLRPPPAPPPASAPTETPPEPREGTTP